MFETLLLNLKDQLMPLCGQMMVMAKALAGLGCLTAIGMTAIRSMADNEPVNVWAYVKPISLGICIMMFEPVVIRALDGILQPIARATSSIAETQEADYNERSDRLEDELSRRKPSDLLVYRMTREAGTVAEENVGELSRSDYEEMVRRDLAADIEYKKTWFMGVLEVVLQVFSYAARMIINIVGTFFLVILGIMGPLAFAVACFPMFESSVSNWLTHYITVSLWLPIANLLTAALSLAGRVLCEQQLESLGGTGTVNSVLMLAMMVVGIFGYFSVPSLANWIVQAGGSGSYARNMSHAGRYAAGKAASGVRSGIRNVASRYGGGFKNVASIISKSSR